MIRKRIIKEIKKQGFKQKDLASSLGVRSATISDFLNGKSEPKLSLIEGLMKELNITLNN